LKLLDPFQKYSVCVQLGFSEEEIKILSRESRKLSKFSLKNILEPWLTRHCKMLGKSTILAVLRETVNNLRQRGTSFTNGQKKRGDQ
jgi:hypothetical protein